MLHLARPQGAAEIAIPPKPPGGLRHSTDLGRSLIFFVNFRVFFAGQKTHEILHTFFLDFHQFWCLWGVPKSMKNR